MKGLVYKGDEVLSWEDVPEIALAPDEVNIRVKAAGICGSDVHGYKGVTGRRIPPMIMGHEFAGEIVGMGAEVKDYKVGDRVCVNPVNNCGECEFCRQRLEQFCVKKRQYGCLAENGAFQEYLCVDAKCLIPLADSVSYSEGACVEPLAVGVRAVNRAGNIEGRNILIVGAGTIGLTVLMAAKRMNPAKIIVSDMSDIRLELAKKIGADITVNPAGTDAAEFVRSQTGGAGVDVSFEAVGVPATVNQALDCLKIKGRAVIMGQGVPKAELNVLNMCVREPEIVGSFMYSYEEFRQAAELINSGEVDVTPIISAKPAMDRAPEYFSKLSEGAGSLIKVVLTEIKDDKI